MDKQSSFCKYEPAKFDESELVKLTTPSGMEMTLARIEDLRWDANFLKTGFMPDFRENLKKIRNMECRADDVFISAYPKSGVPKTWFDYTLEWESALKANKDNKILCVYYEDMQKNLKSQIRKLADFLDVKCSEALCNDIADKCNFKNLKSANEKIKKSKHGTTPNPEMGDNWKSMFRKGEVGDWKNWFTVAENEVFDNMFAYKMKNSQFTYTFE